MSNYKTAEDAEERRGNMEYNILTEKVIGFAMNVHSSLGPGLLESVYKECLYYKINKAGIFVEKEKPVPVFFEGIKMDCGFRADLLVENKLLIELKSVKALENIHMAQILTYLRLGNYKLGLLINFNVLSLKEGIKRVVNKL
jgi:GxxExxY protein